MRNEKINEVKKKREQQKNGSDSESDDYDTDLSDVFKGHNVKPYNIQNETDAWSLVESVA